MADNAVKRNKQIIQYASRFNAWVKDTETVVLKTQTLLMLYDSIHQI